MMILDNNYKKQSMEKEQIDWKQYHEELLSSLSNERIWSMGCNGDHNYHLQNIAEIEEDLVAINNSQYDLILSKHSDTPEYFEDFLLPPVK